jgi:hypothetical protein
MGTVHDLSERRADRPGMRPGAEQLANWTLLAARAEDVLAALEAAAAGRRRPGLAALAGEAAGLRTALEDAFLTVSALKAVWEEAYARGAAAEGRRRAVGRSRRREVGQDRPRLASAKSPKPFSTT